ncbi:MAG: RIP metalloprotease RseP, partial [Proteobacteria bacterium]|nr:RIP metalloprotease RseP [Pseudomonadota bacterium]
MIDWLERGAAFVVAISVLIAVHEFGHFWVARRLGFKVLKFSIGFGRALVSRTGRDGVEYALSVIPLGGYVKLVDEREAEVADADRPRAFNRRPVWQRILVLLAGAGANFLFAIVALWVLYLVGVPGLKPVVGDVRAASIAAGGGLKRGDELVAVGDHEVATRGDAVLEMLSQIVDGGRLELKLRRAGGTAYATLEVPPAQRRALTEPGAWNEGLGFDWAPPHLPAVVARVVPDGAAAAAGLAAGDEIVGLDGRPVADFLDFRSEISARPGAHVVLDVRRGAARLSLPLTVAGKRDPAGRLVGQIGVEAKGPAVYPPELRVLQRYGPLGAVRPALAEAWSNAAVTVKFLWRMVMGDVSLRNVS